MPRLQKGQRYPGAGRKPGTPNKKTVEFIQLLEKHSYDPGEELIYCYRKMKKLFQMRARKGNLSGALSAIESAASVANDIAQFVYPRKKAIEHTGELNVKTFADFIEAGLGEEPEEGEE